MMPRLTYRARIALIVVLGLAAVWIASLSLFYVSHREQGSLRPLPSQVVALVRLLESAPASERALILAAATSEQFTARVEPGADLPSPPPHNLGEFAMNRALAEIGGRSVSVRTPPSRNRLMAPVVPQTLEIRVVLRTGETLLISTRSVVLVSMLGLPVGFGAGLFGTLVALIGLVLMQREAAPLVQLAAAVDGVDLSRPVRLPSVNRCAPEIRALIAAFDRMQTRLAALIAARMAMLGGISHDVRTFATRLRLRADHIADETERGRAVADIAAMIRLLDDALLASRSGAGELAEELIDVAEVLHAEAADRAAQHAPCSVLAVPPPDAALVLGERLALRRILGNLIDNAIMHGHAARLTLTAEAADVVLTVDDEGPGIPAAARTVILEPFVRLEASRSRETGGAGLGLAIVRSLVDAHEGSITIADAPNGGGRFIVRLPRYRIKAA
jgi:signal transduction histidine kinase